MRLLKLSVFTLACSGAGLAVVWSGAHTVHSSGHAVLRPTVDLEVLQEGAAVGDVIDAWRGIPVRANGIPYHRSHGGHHAASGYYYGRQWQCVEYVKRFYHDRFGHWMPDVMGHAKSFYDPAVPHGQVNPRRALLQFANGGDEPPRLDDLMAWDFGDFGHVAIVSKVEAKEGMVEVVQQNVRQGSRERFSLVQVDGRWEVRGRWNPVGWMRAR